MRESTKFLLCSDWLPIHVAPMTTLNTGPRRDFGGQTRLLVMMEYNSQEQIFEYLALKMIVYCSF